MRRAGMPTFLASLFRQWSFVSSHERGPPMATSMGRALSRADAADIALASAEIDGFSVTACSMVGPMSEAEDRRSCRTERIGDVLGRMVGKLAAQRNRRVATPQDAATRCPVVFVKPRGDELGATGGAKEAGPARPNLTREASVASLRSAIGGDGKGPTLRREDAGEDRRAGAGVFGLSRHASGGNGHGFTASLRAATAASYFARHPASWE